jgi:uncharacterized iron-regulated membrane protein
MTTTVNTYRRGDAAMLRRIWRLPFRVGLFAAPMLVILAVSGLVILYSQPINDWLIRDLLIVDEATTTVPLDGQLATATSHVSESFLLDAVIPPAGSDKSTRVHFVMTGVVIAVIQIGYVVSGLTWSRYWGENWRAFSAEVAPPISVDALSTPASLGDYDRLGRRIAWAAEDDPVYASPVTGPVPARLSLEDVDRIGKDEGMVPGYAIIPPSDSTKDGETIYGSYTVVNAWPQRLSEQRTLHLNQFTGAAIANATARQDGTLSRLTSLGIATRMGNQFGLLNRIMYTVAALGVILSVVTGLLMCWKRRSAGKTGLPSPASACTRADAPKRAVIDISVAAVALCVIYLVFGVSLLAVLAVEAVLAARRRSRGKVEGNEGVPVGQAQPGAEGEDTVGDDTLVGSR